MNSKGFGSLLVSGALLRADLGRLSGPLRGLLGRLGSVLGRLGGVLGASLHVLAGKTVLEPFWSRPGSILEASWGRLGQSWKRLGTSCGPLRGFLGRLVWLLERLGASWRHLVRDFCGKKWLHVSLASEMPFFRMDFC